jgi:hypothetical protein
VHVQITALAIVFGVREPSIWRNLTEHRFDERMMDSKDLPEFAQEPDKRKTWLKMIQIDGLFTQGATAETVRSVPTCPPEAKVFHKNKHVLDFIPYQLTGVLDGGQVSDLLDLKKALGYDDDRARTVIQKAWDIWPPAAGDAPGGNGTKMKDRPYWKLWAR